MGVAVKIGGTFYTVTTPIAYRVGSSGDFETTKRFLFVDPITGTLRDGYTENVAPPDPTSAGLSFNSTATGSSNYRSVITWTQNPDEDGNESLVEFVRETTPTASTDNFTTTDVTTGSRSLTRNIYGNDDASLTYGSDRVRYAIRVRDSDDEVSGYAYTPYKTIPPKLPTSPAITSTSVISNIPVPTFSWTRTTTNNTVDNYILTINRPNGTVDTQTLAGTVSTYTPTANTGYSGGGTVSYTIKARSTQNSETTDSPVTTSSVSFVLPPEIPGALTTSGETNNSITYSWGAASGLVTGYKWVLRTYDTSSAYTETTGTTTSSSRSYTYTIPNGTYQLVFFVYSTYGGKDSLEYRSHTYAVPPPTATTSTPSVSGTTVTFSWSYANTTNLVSQTIYYRTQASASYTAEALNVGDRSKSVTTGVPGDVSSFYIVSSSEYPVSRTATTRSVQLAPAIPATLSVTSSSNSSVTWTWTAPSTGIYDGYYRLLRVWSTSSAYTDSTEDNIPTSTTTFTYSIPDSTYLVELYIYSTQGSLYSGGRVSSYYPVPPTTSSGSVTFTNGTATASWSYSSTTNLHSQRIYYRANGSASYSFTDLDASARSATWAGQSGQVASFYIRSYSESTNRNGSTYSGTCPTSVDVSSARFTSGQFVANWTHSANNTGYDVIIRNSSGGLVVTESVGAVGSVTSGAGYYSVGTSYYCEVRAKNSFGSGYLGIGSGNKLKIPNPYVFTPTATYTFKEGFNTASARWVSNEMIQGAVDDALTSLSRDQEYVGLYFYGTAFDNVLASNIGYTISAGTSAMVILRQGSGGSSAERRPYIAGHQYTSVNTALTAITTVNTSGAATSAGTAVSKASGAGWGFNSYENASIPASMGNAIIAGHWDGIAFRTGETTAPSGTVSTNYAAWGFYEGTFGAGTFYLYHDG